MREKEIEAIHAVREATTQAENTGDANFFGEACTGDVVVMPPGMPAVLGRDATVEFMREFFREVDFHIEYVSEEIQLHGDLAFDRGTYSHTLTPKAGGEPMLETGKFLWLYSRDSNESWKMARVMWNANGPASGAS